MLGRGVRRFLSGARASPLTRYNALVASGRIRSDAAQLAVLADLSKLERVLVREHAARAADVARLAAAPPPDPDDESDSPLDPRPPRTPKGLYVYGSVGTGKSMCCDLFFNSLATKKKRRVHFHAFMLEVHARLHAERSTPGGSRAALERIGLELAVDAEVLCFDEMQVTDVADAMLARSLFDACWDAGLILVATSNRPPDDLYENGLNREYFLPFVERLKRQCRVVEMSNDTDHRRLRMDASDRGAPQRVRYLVLNVGLAGEDADAEADAVREAAALCAVDGLAAAATPPVAVGRGRFLAPAVGLAGGGRTGAVFSFSELCVSERGAADYGALARAFDVVAVADVPKFGLLDHDAARRFITLIDELYEARRRVVVVARAAADDLFPTPENFARDVADREAPPPGLDRVGGPSAHDRAFGNDRPDPVDDAGAALRALELSSVRELAWAFRRAASRLTEMASPGWPRSAEVSSVAA